MKTSKKNNREKKSHDKETGEFHNQFVLMTMTSLIRPVNVLEGHTAKFFLEELKLKRYSIKCVLVA